MIYKNIIGGIAVAVRISRGGRGGNSGGGCSHCQLENRQRNQGFVKDGRCKGEYESGVSLTQEKTVEKIAMKNSLMPML